MNKTFRAVVLVAIVLIMQLVVTPPNIAIANEDQISVTELNLKIMPEFVNPEGWDYNIPSLLIGYHGTFTNHSNQPYDGELKVSVPTDLPQFTPGFVAQYIEDADEHIELSYEISEEGRYFVWTPPEAIPANGKFNFILEFFSAPIEGVVERSFNYQFLPENKLENLNLTFYAPFKVEDFEVDKEPTETTHSFGVKVEVFEYSEVEKGEALDFGVTYTKDNIVTTVEAFNDLNAPDDDIHQGFNEVATGDQTNQPTQKSNDKTSLISTENIILIVITIFIIAAFLFIILKKKDKDVSKTKEPSKTPKRIVNKEEEIKKLRKMLAEGQIDEKTYKEKRSHLN